MKGLIKKPNQGSGLLTDNEPESENQPAQLLEKALKKKRVKMYDKLDGIKGDDLDLES